MKYFTVALIIFLSVSDLFAQKKVVINGYYLTLEGDTVYGNLFNKNDMYLIYRSPEGKKKSFTPSKIKGFRIDENDYRSAFLPDIKFYRFLKVLETGDVFLFKGNDKDFEMNNPLNTGTAVTAGPAGRGIYVGVQVPIRKQKAQIVYSGLYIQKGNDTILLSVPAIKESLYLFMEEHFSDNDSLVQEFIDHSSGINDFGRFIWAYNFSRQKRTED